MHNPTRDGLIFFLAGAMCLVMTIALMAVRSPVKIIHLHPRSLTATEAEATERYHLWVKLGEFYAAHIDSLYLDGYRQALHDVATHEGKYCVWDGKVDHTQGFTISHSTIYSTGIVSGLSLTNSTNCVVSDSVFNVSRSYAMNHILSTR